MQGKEVKYSGSSHLTPLMIDKRRWRQTIAIIDFHANKILASFKGFIPLLLCNSTKCMMFSILVGFTDRM